MRFQWRDNILKYLKTGDFTDFEMDFKRLVGIVCRSGFSSRDFGLPSWDRGEIEELSQEILLRSLRRGLQYRFQVRFRKHTDLEWNSFFKVTIRRELLKMLRKKKINEVPLEDSLESTVGELPSDLATIRDSAQGFLSKLTSRQRRVLYWLCQDEILEKIASRIGFGRSTVHNEKWAVFALIREARHSGQNMEKFIRELCQTLERKRA